jgi:hypothetical protein
MHLRCRLVRELAQQQQQGRRLRSQIGTQHQTLCRNIEVCQSLRLRKDDR